MAAAGEGDGRKPDPVDHIVSLQPEENVQVIEYYYDQEDGDTVKFEFKKVDEKKGFEGVFTVTRSSNKKPVLDISKVIPENLMDKFDVTEKKKHEGKYSVTFTKRTGHENINLAQYFCLS